MNPFDLKAVLLARHAQHVVLIHFPIALFLVSVAFDFLAQWWRKAAFAAAAYYNLTVAAFASIPAVATGLMAWQAQANPPFPLQLLSGCICKETQIQLI